MKTSLKPESIIKAISHIELHRDTDLFPHLKEYDMLFMNRATLMERLVSIDIGNYIWQPFRRCIVPKDEVSYRVSIQLDPIDNILFEAIIYEYGHLIEKKRVPLADNRVFSNRFAPDDSGTLYNKKNAWKNYWKNISLKVNDYPYAVYIDIADFYNRVYHHTLENQMIECGFPNQICKAIKGLLQNTTQTVSQGIPVGTHASHLLAEMYLIPLDDGMTLKGYDFYRYMDDIFIFAPSEVQAKIIVYEMAKMLDALKLNMQRQKTKIYSAVDLRIHCEKMQEIDPANDSGSNIVRIISKYSTEDPYQPIDYANLDEEEQRAFSADNIQVILSDYLSDGRDYQRIRWLYKCLAKTGIDSALAFTLDNIDDLMPAINDIALYFSSVATISDSVLAETGRMLLNLLNNDIVKSNEFFQQTILNLFASTDKFNNIATLLQIYSGANDYIKREIILAAYTSKAIPWVREIRHEYNNLSLWGKRALVMASSLLPKDERKFFLQTCRDEDNLALSLLKDICREI